MYEGLRRHQPIQPQVLLQAFDCDHAGKDGDATTTLELGQEGLVKKWIIPGAQGARSLGFLLLAEAAGQR